MSAVRPNRRPAPLSAACAVVGSLFAVTLLAPSAVTPTVGAELTALALFAAGATVARRGRRVTGWLLALVGLLGAVAASALLWTATGDLLTVAQFLPGLVGAAVVAVGVVPLYGRGSRRLVKLGTALVFASVLLAGVVQRPPLVPLLGGGVLSVVAWDAGENAIGLGSQVGRRARTYGVEAVHLLWTALVGGFAVALGQVTVSLGSPGLPVGAFAVLVIGLVLLAGALHG